MTTLVDDSRFVSYLLGRGQSRNIRQLNMYPDLRAEPWYDPSLFPITRALEESVGAIKDEISRIGTGGFHPEKENIAREGNWDTLPLYQRGRKNVPNCFACPVTTEIIESYDTIRTLAGLIYFSRLGPHSRVAAHAGPTNLRLRCHLGLSIPTGECGLRLAGINYTWAQDKCIIFDDSFVHEVWNSSEKERVVLIVDLWHPDLSQREILLLKTLHAYTAVQGEALNRYWRTYDAGVKTAHRPREYD